MTSIVSRLTQTLSLGATCSFASILALAPTQLHAQTSSSTSKPIQIDVAQPVTTPLATPGAKSPIRSTPPTQQPAPKPVISSTSQPPVAENINLVLKLNQKRVYVYKGEKVIAKYPVAIGKKGWETPVGEWQVLEKITNPAWTSFKTGEVFPPGGENPLGARWIGFWTDGQDVIGFHGTPNIKSVGTAASHGCVRMYNRDVKALYKLVKVGTVVKVVKD